MHLELLIKVIPTGNLKKRGVEDKERVKGKKRRVQHAIPAQKNREMNHIQHLVEDMGTCVCVRWLGVCGEGGCLKGVFKIILTSSLRERQRQGQVN